MTLELTLDEIIHLAHCTHKMTALAEKSRVIAEALDIDPSGRQKLRRIAQKTYSQTEKHLTTAQKETLKHSNTQALTHSLLP